MPAGTPRHLQLLLFCQLVLQGKGILVPTGETREGEQADVLRTVVARGVFEKDGEIFHKLHPGLVDGHLGLAHNGAQRVDV
jgi:hypothetical protein